MNATGISDSYLFQGNETLFVDVILPLPLPKVYTYRVPSEMNAEAQQGKRAIVQFGAKKILSCIISKVHRQAPKDYQAKYVLEVIDQAPIVLSQQLKLFSWISEYYMCTLGEVLNATLPSALKLNSESKVSLNPTYEGELNETLSIDEEKIIYALNHNAALTFSEVSKLLDKSGIHKILKSLLDKEIIVIFEEIEDKYSPKLAKKIRLAKQHVIDQNSLQSLFATLESKPKQLEVLLSFLKQVPVHKDLNINEPGLEKSIISTDAKLSTSSLQTLIKNGIFEEFTEIIPRFQLDLEAGTLPKLSTFQQQIFDHILKEFDQQKTVLLHGITGSGKTEIYINLINQALEAGGQVLFLVPEIALTSQLVRRLAKVFGEDLGVYHSKYSDNERVEIWNGVLSERFRVVLGTRSSVFLPFKNLSLIVVDEEHESSYKQHDPAPRYNAREVSIVLAQIHKANVLLGSATPSLESFYNCKSGKWTLLQLKERFGEANLPTTELINLRVAKKRKKMHGHFSEPLLEEIQKSLTKKDQVILFQNRRGYSPLISCSECSYIPKCKNCAVSLSFHKAAHDLRCHYCGYKEKIPRDCPACGSEVLNTVGLGTEQIEEELHNLIPGANVQRMDLDTTRTKTSYDKIIADFEEQKTQILVGTQMVTKGLDFEHVNLVGIIDADMLINFPDFRGHERAFQLLTQVSGRAGRRQNPGLVFIQTSNPEHFILQKVVEHDYEGFYENEIQERQRFGFPPFIKLIKLTVKHSDQKVSDHAAEKLAHELRNQLGAQTVMGPETPYIFRIRNLFLNDIYIKLTKNSATLSASKKIINNTISALKQLAEFKSTRIIIDVDPA